MRARLWLLPFGISCALAITSCGDDGPTAPPSGGGGGPNPQFHSGNLSAVGSVFVNTFTDNGTWSYRCRLHSGMTGSVQVSAAGVDSPSVTISNNQFTPASVHVKTGSYVKWTLSQGTHTVSRP